MKGVIVCISREIGVEKIMINRNSVKKMAFLMFLEELRADNPFEDIMICMDRLSMHTSNSTRKRMDELGFLYSYSPVVSPMYNPIEEVFAMAKQKIKKYRLDQILNKGNETVNEIIHKAFNKI